MKNADQWVPSTVLFDSSKQAFYINRKSVFAGSWYVADLQLKEYIPVLQKHCKGKLLDAGCGPVPFYRAYRDLIDEVICLDKSSPLTGIDHIDTSHDLNTPLPFTESSFDTILLTDVIAHVYNQKELIAECGRCLSPSGKLILTTPYIYWMASPPNDFFHPSEFALRKMCEEAGLNVEELTSYGGRPDVLLDTLNKASIGKWSHRCFRLLASLLIKTKRYKRQKEKTLYSYPLGYILVASK